MNPLVFVGTLPCGCVKAAATPDCHAAIAMMKQTGLTVTERDTPVRVPQFCREHAREDSE